jgi:hypothetical protein
MYVAAGQAGSSEDLTVAWGAQNISAREALINLLAPLATILHWHLNCVSGRTCSFQVEADKPSSPGLGDRTERGAPSSSDTRTSAGFGAPAARSPRTTSFRYSPCHRWLYGERVATLAGQMFSSFLS